jgi:hypothetical protein
MARKFQSDDVVIHGDGGEAIIERVGDRRLYLLAWRDRASRRWRMGPGALPLERLDIVRHPDPDRVLAEFTAWRLMGNGGD